MLDGLPLGDRDGVSTAGGLPSALMPAGALFSTSAGFSHFLLHAALFSFCFWDLLSWFLVVFDFDYFPLELAQHCPPSAAACLPHASAPSAGSLFCRWRFSTVPPTSPRISTLSSTPLPPASASAALTAALFQIQAASYVLVWLLGC